MPGFSYFVFNNKNGIIFHNRSQTHKLFSGVLLLLLGKKRKLGRQIGEISRGEKLKLTEKVEDKDLLLYLGLTNDANPLYIQQDYADRKSVV